MTDVKVVAPMNMGNTLVFKNKVYNVNVGDTLTVGENGLIVFVLLLHLVLTYVLSISHNNFFNRATVTSRT